MEDSADDLKHRSDTGATSDHTDIALLILLPVVLGNRALEFKSISWLHVVNGRGQCTVVVLLDDEINMADSLYNY